MGIGENDQEPEKQSSHHWDKTPWFSTVLHKLWSVDEVLSHAFILRGLGEIVPNFFSYSEAIYNIV